MGTARVKVNAGDPIAVTLATHNSVSIGNRKNLPSLIIRHRRKNRLPGVEGNSGDAIQVSLESFLKLVRFHSGSIEFKVSVRIDCRIVSRKLAVTPFFRFALGCCCFWLFDYVDKQQ